MQCGIQGGTREGAVVRCARAAGGRERAKVLIGRRGHRPPQTPRANRSRCFGREIGRPKKKRRGKTKQTKNLNIIKRANSYPTIPTAAELAESDRNLALTPFAGSGRSRWREDGPVDN